ncbi:hypothetical protein [uncultured Akkermansia sp.]|uniref:hypothetical protein n=1 Tax=uncultured Akkermansia sp. TaxID=512294 RepID=UPI0025CE17C5|nr:hypothetical protein [uncultured Akkermansia sp.]
MSLFCLINCCNSNKKNHRKNDLDFSAIKIIKENDSLVIFCRIINNGNKAYTLKIGDIDRGTNFDIVDTTSKKSSFSFPLSGVVTSSTISLEAGKKLDFELNIDAEISTGDHNLLLTFISEDIILKTNYNLKVPQKNDDEFNNIKSIREKMDFSWQKKLSSRIGSGSIREEEIMKIINGK